MGVSALLPFLGALKSAANPALFGAKKIGVDGTMLVHMALRRAQGPDKGVWSDFERQVEALLHRVLAWGDEVTVRVVCDGGRPMMSKQTRGRSGAEEARTSPGAARRA